MSRQQACRTVAIDSVLQQSAYLVEGEKRVRDATQDNAIYLADARSMPELPDNSVALVVTSPPYFNIKDYSLDGYQAHAHSRSTRQQVGDLTNFRDYLDALLEVWKECARVLRPNGKLVINAPLMPMLKREYSTHENRHIFDLNAEIQHSILETLDSIFLMDTYVWNRTNPSKSLMFGSYPYPPNFYAQNTVEFVTVYVKQGKPPSFDDDVRQQSRLGKAEWVEMTKQVWNFPVPNKGDKAFGAHAALMPEQIAERCVRLYSLANDIVLDPFAGSGTTLKVAKELGRRFIGYEIVEGYSTILEQKTGVKPKKPKRNKELPLSANSHAKVPPRFVDSVQVADYAALTKNLPSNCVDVVCVDPPYNLGVADWDSFTSDNEFMSFTRSWLSESIRILRPGGALWLFNTPRNAAHICVHLEKRSMELRNWITWNKKDGLGASKSRFVAAQETILYFTKPGGIVTFDPDAVRVPYESTSRIEAAKTKGILKNGKRWYPNEKGKLSTDVWLASSDRHTNKVGGRIVKPEHPTIKPMSILQRIVLATSRQGDVIVDFFCGTGTTLAAAKTLGRHYIGGDSSLSNVELSKLRLAAIEWGEGLGESRI